MDHEKYVFVGNREYVLKEMINKGLNVVAVWVMKKSFLNMRLCENHFINYEIIESKQQLLSLINTTEYDILISNGCKYILPISSFKEAEYINIHPSFLPDLKGLDPINGALLFDRECGATCHKMDDGVDTGPIISRIDIPITDDLDAALLFQLCFKAEVIVFNEAYNKRFRTLTKQPQKINAIYYSQKFKDRLICFNVEFSHIIRQVKAYGYKSKGLFFKCNSKVYRFFDASEITNLFVINYYKDDIDLEVLLVFEDSILFKYKNRIMRFDHIEESCKNIITGDMMQNCTEEDIK